MPVYRPAGSKSSSPCLLPKRLNPIVYLRETWSGTGPRSFSNDGAAVAEPMTRPLKRFILVYLALQLGIIVT
ncbi:MAG: hypothetical protein ACK55S_14790, partial [Planctomycetota bacterium]